MVAGPGCVVEAEIHGPRADTGGSLGRLPNPLARVTVRLRFALVITASSLWNGKEMATAPCQFETMQHLRVVFHCINIIANNIYFVKFEVGDKK